MNWTKRYILSKLILPIDENFHIYDNVDEIEFVCQSNETKKRQHNNNKILDEGKNACNLYIHTIYAYRIS